MLFPNRYQQDGYIPSGKIVTIPGGSTPFRFRLNQKGSETIVSFCNASNRWSGVRHDFGSTPFTTLDSFADFLHARQDFLANRKPTFGRLLPLFIAESSLTVDVE